MEVIQNWKKKTLLLEYICQKIWVILLLTKRLLRFLVQLHYIKNSSAINLTETKDKFDLSVSKGWWCKWTS